MVGKIGNKDIDQKWNGVAMEEFFCCDGNQYKERKNQYKSEYTAFSHTHQIITNSIPQSSEVN